MRLTEEIREAIRKAMGYNSQRRLAEISEVKQENISKYLNGRVKTISDNNWEKLFPVIKAYLPENNSVNNHSVKNKISTSDRELELLKREAKLAQLRLEAFYINRKIRKLTNPASHEATPG